MSNAKRFLSVMIAIVMVFSTLVIGANAAYVEYKNSAIEDQYNALDKAVLTTEQYASAAMDEVDRMLTKEQLKFTREDIFVGDIDLTSLDAAMDSIYGIVHGPLFSSVKGMLGDLQNLNVDAFATEDKGGVRRGTAGKTDLDIIYAVFQFLHDNTDLLVSFVEGELDPGSIVGSLIDLSEFMDVNKLLKGLLYEFTYGEEGTDQQVVASSIDAMAQELIDKYVVDGYYDDDGDFQEPLVPALEGMTNISTGTTYTFLDNVLKVLYNELLVPLINDSLGPVIGELCGVVYTEDEATGEVIKDDSNLNEYANLLNYEFEVPTFTFGSGTLISQLNNIVKSVIDQLVKPGLIEWKAGDSSMFKENLVGVAKALLNNASGDLFADYIEMATPEEIEAMTSEELVIYAARAVVNSLAYGMYIPEASTLREFAFYALQQVLATDVPALDFSSLDKNSTDSLVIMGIDYAIYSVSSELDMGLEYVYTMDGVDAQIKKAMDYAIENYSGVLNGIKFNESASGWANLNTLLFSIIPANWLPASANDDLKTFILNLADTIADLDFDALFELFEYRSDSELQKTPKQVIINLVTRVINIIFPGAFKASTTLDGLVTNQALAGTVRAIFDGLWTYKAKLAKVILPILCGILDLTNDQEFEFPELTWDPEDSNIDGNTISCAGSINAKLMVRNGSTGINTGYTDANGKFTQDKLYNYDILSVTTNISTLTVTYPDTIAGGQTGEFAVKGSVSASQPLIITITYDVLTETGAPLTDEPITETIYSYIARNEATDATQALTSTAVGGFSIVDGPKYLYANSFSDLEDITITIQNNNTTPATAVPHYAQTPNAANRLLGAGTDGVSYLQVRTEETAVMQKVDDNVGLANIKIFEATDAYNALTGEEKDAVWDSIIEYGTMKANGAVTRYPRIQNITYGAKIGSTTVQNATAVVFCYKDFGLPGMLDSEMGKHRQAAAYADADSTVFGGLSVWEAYNKAMEDAAKAVYSTFRNGTFSNAKGGKASLYEPAYNNLKAAIEELDAQVLSAGVASTQALIDEYFPSNPEDMTVFDPNYNHQGVLDYVPYTYYNFRDELRTAQAMIDSATIPDEEGNVAVVNELDKAYNEHRLTLYYGRLLKVPSYKMHLERELQNPSREIGAESDYTPESWEAYEVALAFANSVVNEANPNQSKIKNAYRELLECEKRLVAPTAGGGEDEEVSFTPVQSVEILEEMDGTLIATGIGYDLADVDYFNCVGCYVELTENERGEFSTGALIEIKSNADDSVLATYTVAVFGDINGDNTTDIAEISEALAVAGGAVEATVLVVTASDVNLDGATDISDIPEFLAAASGAVSVDPVARVIA